MAWCNALFVHFFNTGFRRTAAISIAAFLKNVMKNKILILFVLATVAFCVLLYWLLFYVDQKGKSAWIVLLSIGLVLCSVLLIWLYCRYFSFSGNKRVEKETQVSSP
jgi:type VI protein secretion system component VasK